MLYYFLKHKIHYHYTVIKIIYTMFIKDSILAQAGQCKHRRQSGCHFTKVLWTAS